MIGIDDVPEPDMTGPAKVNKIHPEDPDYSDFPVGPIHEFGTIEEIREGVFGGVKPLKYVDLNGVRIIHGIGVTEWNDGECLLGPANLYNNSFYFKGTPQERHYRSMLVHFERDGEVLYDVWPEKGTTTGIVFPLNPSDKEMVNGKSSNRKLFDLQGRRLSGKPVRGTYIENGKKILY